MSFRSFLYHWTCPEGIIFTDKEAYEQAKEAGWVCAPWKAVKPKSDPAPPPAPVKEKLAVKPKKPRGSPKGKR